jgi:4-amino-4-deoxy-L-arabinose transferase-like glycosyltransferase
MSIEGFYKSRYFLYEWLQALSFKFAGISDFTARFPSVIFQL